MLQGLTHANECFSVMALPWHAVLHMAMPFHMHSVLVRRVRVAQSLEATAGGRVEQVAVTIEGIEGAQQAFGDAPSTSGRSGLVTLTNVYAQGQAQPQVSSLAINAAIPEQQQAHLAAAVAQFVGAAQPRTVLLVAAAVLPGVKKSADTGGPVSKRSAQQSAPHSILRSSVGQYMHGLCSKLMPPV